MLTTCIAKKDRQVECKRRYNNSVFDMVNVKADLKYIVIFPIISIIILNRQYFNSSAKRFKSLSVFILFDPNHRYIELQPIIHSFDLIFHVSYIYAMIHPYIHINSQRQYTL